MKLKILTQSISLSLITSTAAQSAEFVVTTTGDGRNGVPNKIAPGIFEINTLRSAIRQADNEIAFPGADRIRFHDDLFINNQATINLDRVGDSFTFFNRTSNSALGINSEIMILGPQSATLSLTAGELRHFQVNNGGHLNISQVTLDEGFAQSDASGRGGAIYVRTGGSLKMSHTTLSNNHAHSGGAIFIGKTVSGVPSKITHSRFTGNQSSSGGGAVFLYGDLQLTISESTFVENSSVSGGAIFSSGNLLIESSTIHNNTARSDGGGLATNNVGAFSLINSTLTDNRARFSGGGVLIGTSPGRGFNTIINSTITGNQSLYDSPTVATRKAFNRGGVIEFDTSGGGVLCYEYADTLVIHNSIIVGNTETTAMLPDDVATCPLPESSHNFIGAGDSVLEIEDGLNGNQIGTRDVPIDAQLKPLTDNGGDTLTQLPNSSSPVIDAGNNKVCTSVDQRGFVRPYDGDVDGSAVCDIGAVELGSISDLIFNDDFEDQELNKSIFKHGFEN